MKLANKAANTKINKSKTTTSGRNFRVLTAYDELRALCAKTIAAVREQPEADVHN